MHIKNINLKRLLSSKPLKGFTIVELIVVIVVIGILATITIVSYGGYQKTVAITQLKADLSYAASAMLKVRSFGESGYPADINSISTVKASQNVNLSGGSNDGGKTYCIDAVNSKYPGIFYYIYSIHSGLDAQEGNCASVYILPQTLPPLNPVVVVDMEGNSIRTTITPLTCSAGTIQYGIREKTNDDIWSIYSDWSTTSTYYNMGLPRILPPDGEGIKYSYQAQARCYVDNATISSVATGTEASYISTISTPSAPAVAASTVSNTTTWSWPASACGAGTASYKYRYTISPSGYDSGWVANGTNSSIGFTTSTVGQTYTVAIQANCSNVYATSAWSVSGSASYSPFSWIAGIAATVMAGKFVASVDLGSLMQYKTTATAVAPPQGIVGLDPNYPSKMGLVNPQTNPNVDFSAYAAQTACKTVGGRLPNVQELLAIYAGRATYGNNFQSSGYWSSTEFLSDAAYTVVFSDGSVNYSVKTNTPYVRCVSDLWIAGIASTAMAGKYVKSVDLGTTYQYETTTTLVASPQGATGLDPNYPTNMVLVSPQTNTGVDFSAYPAQNACKAIGGRLPNMQELLAISAGRATYGNNFQADIYWSATEASTSLAYNVHFDTGNMDFNTKSNVHYVRCIFDPWGNWYSGIAATVLAGKYIYKTDLGSYAYKTTNDAVISPQGATGLDPSYPTKMSLVNPQTNSTVDFSAYPAQNACKAIGGRTPNMQELFAMFTGRATYGNNFQSNYYYSSTEFASNQGAYELWFSDGSMGYGVGKTTSSLVRCISG